jgi:hypothetical protein
VVCCRTAAKVSTTRIGEQLRRNVLDASRLTSRCYRSVAINGRPAQDGLVAVLTVRVTGTPPKYVLRIPLRFPELNRMHSQFRSSHERCCSDHCILGRAHDCRDTAALRRLHLAASGFGIAAPQEASSAAYSTKELERTTRSRRRFGRKASNSTPTDRYHRWEA